jgi:hypothetical protein
MVEQHTSLRSLRTRGLTCAPVLVHNTCYRSRCVMILNTEKQPFNSAHSELCAVYVQTSQSAPGRFAGGGHIGTGTPPIAAVSGRYTNLDPTPTPVSPTQLRHHSLPQSATKKSTNGGLAESLLLGFARRMGVRTPNPTPAADQYATTPRKAPDAAGGWPGEENNYAIIRLSRPDAVFYIPAEPKRNGQKETPALRGRRGEFHFTLHREPECIKPTP